MGLLEIGTLPRRYIYLLIASGFSLFLLLAYHKQPYNVAQLGEKLASIDAISSLRGGTATPKEPAGAKYGPYAKYWLGKHWHGFHNIEHAIIFGDSWSIVAFELDGPQPSARNPIGNPEWPGSTSTNGPCWVNYLTATHNQSLLLTADIAAGGATVDMNLIAPKVPHDALRDLKTQMAEQWPAIYGNHPPEYPWTPDSSIFIIWMGLNDIHNAVEEEAILFPQIFKQFADYVEIAYKTGARNFMFMNIPPIERAPLAESIHMTDQWHVWVDQWNTNITHLAWNFRNKHSDASVFLFDTFKLYGDVMDDPCLYPETCGFEVTTEFCGMYAFGSPTPDLTYSHPKCPYSIDKYFWMNDLHPTTQTHNMTAHAIAQALSTDDH